MNLEKTIGLTQLQRPPLEDKVEKRLSARQVAQLVFKISAQAGEPFVGLTQEEWSRKWLASDEFVLMEIPLNRVAVVGRPATNRIMAMAQVQSPEPIVVDTNKRGVGQTAKGYTPPVIVVDGQTRHQAQILRGREKVLAWVGVKVQAQVTDRRLAPRNLAMAASAASASAPVGPTRMDATISMHAAMPQRPLPRQDSGDGGPQPSMSSNGYVPATEDPDGTSFKKNRGAMDRPKKKVAASGAGGGMGGPGATSSGNNPARKGIYSEEDPSDEGQLPDPSDRYQSPTDESPGAGVGPRVRPSKGGSKSDMAKILSEGKKVDKIFEAKKKMKAFGRGMVGSPPGRTTGMPGGSMPSGRTMVPGGAGGRVNLLSKTKKKKH